MSISVEVHLQATGDAPIMKQKKYKVDGEKRIDWIIAFIRKFLKLEPTDSLVSDNTLKYATIVDHYKHCTVKTFQIIYIKLHFFQFLYVNQAFAPSPDQTVKNLCECFGHNGKLVLHYARSQAWGWRSKCQRFILI